jgi:GNAT superfamily N-acetyltransferase
MLEIKEVKSRRDIKDFIEFPIKLYKGCSHFAPPLYTDEKKLLCSERSSDTQETVFYLAKDGKRVLGRIQGIIQKQYNGIHKTAKVRFTRFDCINDKGVAEALLRSVEKWGKERGMSEICGPLGANDLEREGLLVEGFDEDATFEEQYNFEYYGELIESLGYRKDVDWLEFELRKPEKRNEMLARVAKRTLELHHLHVASTDMPKRKYIKKYRDGFFECLDVCYRDLYGTVPISKEAQDELVKQFMMIVNKNYAIFICDADERVVGFGLCFPSIADAVKKSHGRLTPAALVRILKATKNTRIIDLGLVAVRPEYQNAGINAVILDKMLEMLDSGKIEKCETNLNLETNVPVISQWKYFNARQHKRRRSFIKKLEDSYA